MEFNKTNLRSIRRWKEALPGRKRNRTSRRFACGGAVRIWWEDKYGFSTVQGMCLDISDGGLAVGSSEPLPRHTHVHVQLQSSGAIKHAALKYCLQRGEAFFSGLEFINQETDQKSA